MRWNSDVSLCESSAAFTASALLFPSSHVHEKGGFGLRGRFEGLPFAFGEILARGIRWPRSRSLLYCLSLASNGSSPSRQCAHLLEKEGWAEGLAWTTRPRLASQLFDPFPVQRASPTPFPRLCALLDPLWDRWNGLEVDSLGQTKSTPPRTATVNFRDGRRGWVHFHARQLKPLLGSLSQRPRSRSVGRHKQFDSPKENRLSISKNGRKPHRLLTKVYQFVQKR